MVHHNHIRIQQKKELLQFLLRMHLQLLIQEPVIEEFVLFQKKKPRQYYSSIHVSIGQKFIISSVIFFYKAEILSVCPSRR